MAELVLEQVLTLGDSLEEDNYTLAEQIVAQDDAVDELEKDNDNLSQNAILEAIASRNVMGMGNVRDDILLKRDPLRFALSCIRITRNMERLGDQVVNVAEVFKNGNVRKKLFKNNEVMCKILSRVITLVGMAVESLVEEKDRFMGSVNSLEQELNDLCNAAFYQCMENEAMDKKEFADIYRMVLSMERIGDYSVNIAEELVRLNTGQDIRHMNN